MVLQRKKVELFGYFLLRFPENETYIILMFNKYTLFMLEKHNFGIFVPDQSCVVQIFWSTQMFPFQGNKRRHNFFKQVQSVMWVMQTNFFQQITLWAKKFCYYFFFQFFCILQNKRQTIFGSCWLKCSRKNKILA